MAKLIGLVALAPPSSAIAAEVVTLSQSTTSLAQYASDDLNFLASKSGILAGFWADKSCIVRVYISNAARAADTRAYNVGVPPTGVTGLIAEVEIDISIADRIDTNVIFGNTTDILYFKVFNLGTVGAIALNARVAKFQSFAPVIPSFMDLPGLSDPVIAFSLRRAATGYTGSAIKVRRSSDNVLQDIGFDSQGNLDESSLLAFIGGSNGFIERIYSQNGVSIPAVAPSNASQPRIALGGVIDKENGKPCIVFDGIDDYLVITGQYFGYSVMSVFWAAKIVGTAFGGIITAKQAGRDDAPAIDIEGGKQFSSHYKNSSINSGSRPDMTCGSSFFPGGTYFLYINGGLIGTATQQSSPLPATNTWIGTYRADIGNLTSFKLAELMVYSGDKAGFRISGEQNIINYWGIE